MSEAEPKVEEEEKAESLFKRAFRQRKGIFENLLCQNLFLGTVAANFETSLAHLSKAVMLAENLKLDIDYDLFKRINALNNSFQNAAVMDYPNEERNGLIRVVHLSFSFPYTEENYKLYVEPWGIPVTYQPSLLRDHRVPAVKIIHRFHCEVARVREDQAQETIKQLQAGNKPCPKCYGDLSRHISTSPDGTLIIENPFWSFFFEAAGCLTVLGFRRLRSAFQTWAMQNCMKAVAIISQQVSPSTYENAITLLRKEDQDQAKRPSEEA